MTMEEVRKRELSKADLEGLKRLAALLDDQIGTSDIPVRNSRHCPPLLGPLHALRRQFPITGS
jgi:hypothetical protein